MYLPPRCPQGALMLFYTARIALLKGNFTFVSTANASTTSAHVVLLAAKKHQFALNLFPLQAQEKFLACIATQKEWRQIHHLCYWELMWAYSFELRWKEAYRYADLLCKENKWSQVQQPAPPLNLFLPIMTFLICSSFAGCLCISESSHPEYAAREGGDGAGGERGRTLQVT